MMLQSRVLKAADFNIAGFTHRAEELCEAWQLHRKLWEFWAISQVYSGFYVEGGHALGFGVGREPLASWLAYQGAQVVATDLPQMTAEWAGTGQHSQSLRDIHRPCRIEWNDFKRRASFRPVDMNDIPEDLKRGQFDFTWSCGSFEHLGSFAHSYRFLCEQMKCLQVGGIAAHTTEYNPDPTKPTIENKDLVLFRDQELAILKGMLAAQGDHLIPVDVTRDNTDVVGPTGYPHYNLALGDCVTTSVLLVVIRGALR